MKDCQTCSVLSFTPTSSGTWCPQSQIFPCLPLVDLSLQLNLQPPRSLQISFIHFLASKAVSMSRVCRCSSLVLLGFCEDTDINTWSKHYVLTRSLKFWHSVTALYSNYPPFYFLSYSRIISSLILETVIFIAFRNLHHEHIVGAH